MPPSARRARLKRRRLAGHTRGARDAEVKQAAAEIAATTGRLDDARRRRDAGQEVVDSKIAASEMTEALGPRFYEIPAYPPALLRRLLKPIRSSACAAVG